MKQLEKVVIEKRLKTAQKRPRYGMRKLSVGLVSCVLGYITFVSPQTVQAQSVEAPASAIVAEVEAPEKPAQDKPKDSKESKPEATEAPTSEGASGANEEASQPAGVEAPKDPGTSGPLEDQPAPTEPAGPEDHKPLEEKEKAQAKPEAAEGASLETNPQGTPEPVGAPAEGEAPANEEKKAPKEYKESTILKDEKNITNGKGYRQSEVAGAGRQIKVTDENLGEEKEGVRVETLQPSPTSDDKRSFGVEVNIDKTKSDRTYNGFLITDSVRGVKVDGKGKFLEPGETLPTNTEDTVTYKPDSNGDEISTGRQTGFDYNSTEIDNKHLANKDTGKVTVAWKGKYQADNPNNKLLQGGNFEVSVGVNPYPNENKNLSLIELEGNTTISKVPVKNQYVVTKAKIKNAEEEDYTRLVGEVYHPEEDILVEGAQALIVNASNIENLKNATGNQDLTIGQIVFKMPEGALQNKDSIFNDNKFIGVQNLRAKFFARPRTAEEFKALADELRGNYGPYSYQSTGAGTKVINHNGQEITIDKQGIDRYDHYNLIGSMTINLDDTKHYDQTFNRIQSKEDTAYSNTVTPGGNITLKINSPSGQEGDPSKSYEDMEKAKDNGLADGKIVEEFKKQAEAKGWIVTTTPGNPSEFTVTAPKDARPGDTMYLPIEYKYTNGSKDYHSFYFVVKETNNVKPEYHAKVGFQGDTLTNTPEIERSDKADINNPASFELVPGTYTDDKGNVWSDVTIDKDTGVVTAKVPSGEGVNIIGGENVFIPVKVNYVDKLTGEAKEEIVKAQFIARPKYFTTVTDEDIKDIPFSSKEEFDENLPLGTIKVITEGKAGKEKTVFEQDVVNGKKGLLDPETGKFTEGDKLFRKVTTSIEEKQDRLVKVGVKPVEETITIPHTIEYIVDPNLKPGEEEMVEEGLDGEITVKTSKDPETGAIKIEKTTKYEMQPMKVRVGAYKHENDIPFDTTVITDDSLPAGTKETVTEGVVGKTETKVTPAKIADMDDMMKKIGEGNFRDQDNTPNYNAIANYMVEKGFWDADKITKTTDETGKVTEAKYGDKTFEDLLMFDEKNNPQGKAVVPGKVETKEVTPKTDKVIKVGTKTTGTVEDTDEIPFGVRVEYDPNFYTNYPDATDNYKVITEGKPGTNKKTWTIVNSKIVGDPKVEKTDPVEAVIKVGQKDYTGEVTNTVTKVIPRDVEIVYNDQVEAGTAKVLKEGSDGSIDVKYTQKIKNGAADGEATNVELEDTRVAPVKKVIEVGTKPATCPIPEGAETPITKEVPVEVEIVYDETKDKGYVEKGEITPGKVETKVVSKIVDGKVVNTEETTITKAKQKVIVGTKDFTGNFEYKDKEIIPYETTVTVNPNLAPNEIVEKTPGKNGSKERTVTQTITNGTPGEQIVGEYTVTEQPTNRVIEIGAKTNGTFTDKEKIPFEITVEKDPSLKKGEWKYKEVDGVKQTGVVGEKERTITIENSKVTNESDYTTTKPAENAVILVGDEDFTGTISHDVTEELPFTVKIEEDPTMDKGKSVVKQQGVAGSKTTTYTQNIKNGAADGEMTSAVDETKTVQPKEHIIRVGTKPLKGEGTVTTTNKKPFEVEIKYDNTKPIGFVEETGGTPGEESTTTKVTSEDGKVTTGDSTTTETTAPVKKVITVGTKDYTGEFKYEHKNTVPFETEIVFDDTMKAGTSEVVTKGENGETTTTVTQTFTNGTKGEQTTNTVENKKPTKQVIKVGSMTEGTHTHTEDIPFDYEVKYDSNIEAGKYEIEVKGEKGTRTTEWTIKNSKVEGEPKVTETQPTNAIIKVGNKDFTGEFKTTETEKVPFETEYQIDPSMKPGEEEVVQDGVVGVKETEITHKIVNGKVTESNKGETKETTKKQNKIVKIGAKTDGSYTYKEEVPFEVKVEVDPTLNKGEYKVETPGKAGEKTTTVTIENSKVVGQPKVEETKPTTQVVKVGSKDFTGSVSHDVTEELGFETKIIEDENLEAGTVIEEQAGKKGSKTTKYTQAIKNGQADGNLKSEVTNETPAQNRVIRVGKKPTTCPVINGTTTEVKNDVPVKIEYVYDKSKDKGTVDKGELTPGKVETKVVSKIVDGKVVNTEETVVTPAKQQIIVGTKDFTGKFTHEEKNTVPYETEIIYDDTVEFGKTETVQEGVNGETTKTITQSFTNGSLGDKQVSEPEVTKKAQNKIVRIGVKPVVTEVEVQPEVEVSINKDLKPGEEKVIQEGQPGKVTITTSFNKVTGKVETKEVKTDPVTKKVEIGAKTEGSHIFKEKTPFDVEIIYDDTMEAGTYKVEREGKEGLKEVIATIVNSEVTSTKETVIHQAVNKVVRVGTKKICPLPTPDPDPSNPEDPVKPDPSKPVDPGKPSDPTRPDPGKPVNPSNPDPGKPDQPSNPDPAKPDQPSNPDPGKPEDPAKPDQSSPEAPKPAEDGKKEDPKVSEKPQANKDPQPSDEKAAEKPNKDLADEIKSQLDSQLPKSKAQDKVRPHVDSSKPDHGKAPQTYDPGVGSYFSLAGLASAALGFLQIRKKKEEED